MSEQPFRIISIDGGGYLGLASASFIADIEQHFRLSFSATFDLFCGTSTGAIIALALARGRTGNDLVSLYRDLGPKVFGKPRFHQGWLRAKFPDAPLRKALESEFGALTLGEIHRSGKKVIVTAFNLTKGMPRVFKTDHHQDLSLDNCLKVVDIAMASAAAPTYLPAVSIEHPTLGKEVFCDGGVAANHPALLGYAEAIHYLGKRPEEIRLLSISTPRMSLARVPGNTKTDLGKLCWASKLPDIFIDSNSFLHDRILECLTSSPNGALYRRIKMDNKDCIEMDQANRVTTKKLQELGAAVAATSASREAVKDILK